MSTVALPQTAPAQRSHDLVHVCAIFAHRYASGPPCTPECVSLCGYEQGADTIHRDDPHPDDCVICTELAQVDDRFWR